VASTYYEVTLMKDNVTAYAPPMDFIIESNTTWTPAAQPMNNPPAAPGFITIRKHSDSGPLH